MVVRCGWVARVVVVMVVWLRCDSAGYIEWLFEASGIAQGVYAVFVVGRGSREVLGDIGRDGDAGELQLSAFEGLCGWPIGDRTLRTSVHLFHLQSPQHV
jgi:hypothetical protein